VSVVYVYTRCVAHPGIDVGYPKNGFPITGYCRSLSRSSLDPADGEEMGVRIQY
jgi:hypothetical protein